MEWAIDNRMPCDFNMKEITRFAGKSENGYCSGSSGMFKGQAELHEAYFLSDLACKWIVERSEKNEKFVLRVDVWGPHQPYFVGEPFAGTIDPESIQEFPNFCSDYSDRSQMQKDYRTAWLKKTGFNNWNECKKVVARAYENMIQVDDAVGRILDTLDDKNLSQNTVVILTADHGDTLGVAGGLFDKGALMNEETMSIPLIVRWSGVVKAGTINDYLVTNMDIVPTVMEICGEKNLDYMDGKSIVPLLKNHLANWGDDLMCQHHGHDNMAFQRALYYKNYKYVAHLNDTDELYDLEKDPYELKNCIDDELYQDMVNEMKRRLIINMKKHKDNLNLSKQLIKEIDN